MKLCTRCDREHSETTKQCDRCKTYTRTYLQKYRQIPGMMKKHRATLARSRRKHPHKARQRHLQSKYNISLGQYSEMYAKQSGKCASCGDSKPTLCVDHDHATGIIRELLCLDCNLALGRAKDSAERLMKLAFYAQRHAVKSQQYPNLHSPETTVQILS